MDRQSVLLTLACLLAACTQPQTQSQPDAGFERERALVIGAYDGDSLTLADRREVRVLGINTPELRGGEPFSQEARAVTQAWTVGKEVGLLVDPDRRYDRYERLLAWVVLEDGRLDQKLLDAGLAHVFFVGDDDTYREDLLRRQAAAREAGFGIWGEPQMKSGVVITSFHIAADDTEYLRVSNLRERPLELKGLHLTNAEGRVLELPERTIATGAAVKLVTGPYDGPLQGGDIHLHRSQRFFDPRRDEVMLMKDDDVLAKRTTVLMEEKPVSAGTTRGG